MIGKKIMTILRYWTHGLMNNSMLDRLLLSGSPTDIALLLGYELCTRNRRLNMQFSHLRRYHQQIFHNVLIYFS